MALNLPTILPQQMPNVGLGQALLGGMQSAQQFQRNKIANEAAQTNLQSLAQMNQARLQEINSANKLREMQAQFMPQLNEAKLSLMHAQQQHLLNPAAYVQPTGIFAQEAYVNNLRNQLGADNPRVIKAQNDLNQLRQQTQSQIAYRNALAKTYGIRALSPLGKSAVEEHNVALYGSPLAPGASPSSAIPAQQPRPNTQMPITSPLAPGATSLASNTLNPVVATPAQRQALANQYEMKRIKDTTDADARKRLRFAAAIDKTVSQIDPDAIANYIGAGKKAPRTWQNLLTGIGKESPDYDKFIANKNAVQALTDQIRQFRGGSVQPEEQARLNKMLDFDLWASNPKLWKQNYNKELAIYRNDRDAYLESMNNPAFYQERPSVSFEKQNIPKLTEQNIKDTMKAYKMSRQEVIDEYNRRYGKG